MQIELTPDDWAIGALLGHARRLSNENRRNKSRDRGNAKNIHVDLMGSMGEIVAFKAFQRYVSEESMKSQMENLFGVGGGGCFNKADFYLDLHPKKLRLDAKTYDCDPSKKFFAINAKKHYSLKGKCDGYSCLLIPKYSKNAFLIPNVPCSDVDDWELKSLGKYGDPSFNMPIGQFVDQYARKSIINDLRSSEFFDRGLIREALKTPSIKDRFFTICPEAKILFS
ncbi:hypothetical protein QTV49_001673 [Vibrio vulnificus]|nr:hypothetical protein [Vibrio vulnificus]